MSYITENKKWTVIFHRKAIKQIQKLPEGIQSELLLLTRDLEIYGPGTSGHWKNVSKLQGFASNRYHCHLIKGRPTYVCCWECKNKTLRILEVYYVGTHEKAPY